ncbi:adenylate kinase family protein [Halococcoides cellulosivorans]|uniref:Putative adenylate kinase n=1 Tax=Halococcoides cellulosivorans TaxID=1679096 RepID=A0A2R4X2Y0_9EURY|nr:adenylate kinase family protein [Halococcoides cellulosivorans]AWB28142.1 adenylate kinase [Halococcoides cellulosivorans]
MRVALTGTPGTGKTTASELLDSDLSIVHLNQLVTEEGLALGHDESRDSAIADLDAITDRLDGRDDVLIESHLAHHLPVDRVVVLRCQPEALIDRLTDRGESAASARENAESEALDVVLGEAVAAHGESAVIEIDTTDRSPAEVAAAIDRAIDGDGPAPGSVSFIEYLT